jgi:hypothetical protein
MVEGNRFVAIRCFRITGSTTMPFQWNNSMLQIQALSHGPFVQGSPLYGANI